MAKGKKGSYRKVQISKAVQSDTLNSLPMLSNEVRNSSQPGINLDLNLKTPIKKEDNDANDESDASGESGGEDNSNDHLIIDEKKSNKEENSQNPLLKKQLSGVEQNIFQIYEARLKQLSDQIAEMKLESERKSNFKFENLNSNNFEIPRKIQMFENDKKLQPMLIGEENNNGDYKIELKNLPDQDGIQPGSLSIIKAPELKSLALESIRVFIEARDTYVKQMHQGRNIVVRVRDTIEKHLLEQVVRKFNKTYTYVKADVSNITDDQALEVLKQLIMMPKGEQEAISWDIVFKDISFDIRKGTDGSIMDFFSQVNRIASTKGLDINGQNKAMCRSLIDKLYPKELQMYAQKRNKNIPFTTLLEFQEWLEIYVSQFRTVLFASKSVATKTSAYKSSKSYSSSTSDSTSTIRPSSTATIVASKTASTLSSTEIASGSSGVCYYCKKPGHKRYECEEYKKKGHKVSSFAATCSSSALSEATISVDKGKELAVKFRWDSGSDICILNLNMGNKLKDMGAKIIKKNIEVKSFDGEAKTCEYILVSDFHWGKTTVSNLKFYIFKGHITNLMGIDVIQALGLDINKQLTYLKEENQKIDMKYGNTLKNIVSRAIILNQNITEEENIEEGPGEVAEGMFTKQAFPIINLDMLEKQEEKNLFNKFINEGLKQAYNKEDMKLPILFPEKLHVQLYSGAKPVRVPPRVYSEIVVEWFPRVLKELVDLNMIWKNLGAFWSSPCHVLCDTTGKPKRQTIDLRQVNQRLVPSAGVMPDLQVAINKASGFKYYTKLDFFKAYWFTEVDDETAQIFSFSTPKGIYSSKRMLQGYHSAVFFFQNSMETIINKADVDYCLWIDDFLLWANTVEELIAKLNVVIPILTEHQIKINWQKTVWIATAVIYLGRQLSIEGTRFDPEKVEGIARLEVPTTGAELCSFIHTVGFMRSQVIDFGRISLPLLDLLEKAMKESGSRKKSRIKNYNLKDKWTDIHQKAFEDIKIGLIKGIVSTPMHSEWDVYVFGDASIQGWGLLITQCNPNDRNLSLLERKHHALACYSGIFRGSALAWTIPAKELYPFTVAVEKASWILHRLNGFTIICDNKAMVNFLNNTNSNSNALDKQFRWKMKLNPFNYTAEHIEGESNHYCDLISRLPTADKKIVMDEKLLERNNEKELLEVNNVRIIDSITNMKFIFPTSEEIFKFGGVQENGIMRIPNENNLRERIFTIGHGLYNGHRGVDATIQIISRLFIWDSMKENIQMWASNCIFCKLAKSPRLIQRPFGDNIRGLSTNAVIHVDHLFLPNDGIILVILDDFTKYTRCVQVDSPDAESTIQALCQWFVDFGFPMYIVSDRGGAFANKLLEEICKSYSIQQNLHSVYVHYSNGSVERMNREINTMIRVLLAELELDEHDWRLVFIAVQFALNHTPLKILNNNSPAQVMLGTKDVRTQLDTILVEGEVKSVKPAQFKIEYQEALEKLITYRGYVNKGIINEKDHQHKLAKEKRLKTYRVSMPHVEVGDFVLVAKPERLLQNKLTLKWRGPEQVVKFVSPFVVTCKNIINGQELDYHLSRVQEYADASYNLTNEVKRIAIYGQKGYEAKEILAHRWKKDDEIKSSNKLNKILQQEEKLEVLIEWLGLPKEEATYISVKRAIEEFPALTNEYLKQNNLQVNGSQSTKQ